MKTTLISVQFNSQNRANLWRLREYYGNLEHFYCDPLGRLTHITAEHADRLMAAGKNVYVDIPRDTEDPNEPPMEGVTSWEAAS